MPARFRHLEILGPRAGLDRWLRVLQDLGTCHIADAMQGHEGHPGIGRPMPSDGERRARRIRSEAGRGLRAVAHALPRAAPSTESPPDWALSDSDEGPLLALRDEARELTEAIRDALTPSAAPEGAHVSDQADPLANVLQAKGPRARVLLGALEDAEARTAVHRRLASTEHVVAVRAYVRPEDEPPLREALGRRFGPTLVVRTLRPADDEPTLQRRLAPYPFAVLRRLRPHHLGETGLAACLALATPLVAALVWGDILGGLLLIAIGALLGLRAGPGAPRRDTAVLAQLAGLVSLVAGVWFGRFAEPAGSQWFGQGWGLGTSSSWAPVAGFTARLDAMAAGLGAVALALAAYAGVACVGARLGDRPGRASQAGALALSAVAAGSLGLAPRLPWLAAGATLIAAWFCLARGGRSLLFSFGLDLVGALRLTAVSAGALTVAAATFGGWAQPHAAAVLVAPLTVPLAALALVADPAYVAMGVPYDVALGGRRLSDPFVPFARTTRGRREGS